MRKQFVVWAILAAAMLGGSTVCGLILRVVVRPLPPDYSRMWGGGGRVAAPVARTDRQPTAFAVPTPPDGPTAELLAGLLQTVCNVREYARPQAWVQSFDVDRMAEEEIALGLYQFRRREPLPPVLASAADEIRLHLQGLAQVRSPLLPGGVVEVVRVGMSPDALEALVIAKHTVTNESNKKTVQSIRWWLSRKTGAWRVYDFDFSDTRFRYLAARKYLNATPEMQDESAVEFQAFHSYMRAVGWLGLAGTATDPAALAASAWNDPIHEIPMPRYVQGTRAAARVRLLVLQGNFVRAQQQLDYAKQQMPAAAYILIAEAVLLNAQKRHTQASQQIKAYRDAVGDDPLAVVEDAKAQAGAKNDPKVATDVLRAGLKGFPGDRTLFLELARRVPREDREAVGVLMAKTGSASLIQDATTVFEQQFPSILDGLCTGYLREDPDNFGVQSRAIQVKLSLGQLKAAGQLLKKVPAQNRSVILDALAFKAGLSTTPVDYYVAVAEVGEGDNFFPRLVPFFTNNLLFVNPKPPDHKKRVENLSAVVAAHREKHPASASLNYGEAVLMGANDEYAKADAELAKGLAKLPARTRTERIRNYTPENRLDETTWDGFRGLRTYFLFKQDKWKQAYAELAPAVDTFDQLAMLMMLEQDEFKLAELCDLHAKALPNDLELLHWRGEVRFLKKDYETAIKLFQEYREKGGRETRQKYRADERLIRCYVRTNRPDDARLVLDEGADRVPIAPLYLALLAAVESNVDGVLEQFDQAPGNPLVWYADPDLGPLLRKPEFARVRQKYPPPVR